MMNHVMEFLEKYIWENGFETLSLRPFDVYDAMIKGGIDQKTARFVLMTLLSKTHEMAEKGCTADELICYIQSEHDVLKKTARDLALMYQELFSDENRKSWNDAREAGFEAFCEEEWTIEWDGSCEWHTKHGGSYPCIAEVSFAFTVQDKEKLRSHLSSELKINPFLSEEEVYDILSDQMEADLELDMEEYCNADDYYEPYMDDFAQEGTSESEARWKSWGLEISDLTGSGYVDYDL